ncbi:MAG TPA: hypothetical protein VGD70_32900, partial [Actinophytocola sp.]
MAAWDERPAAGGLGECAALVRSAEALRFSAPELAVQLARRALMVGAAESSGSGDVDQAKGLSMRAQAVLAAGLVRISNYVEAIEPAFAALALADDSGVADVAMSVRLDLAACSREVGEPLLGCALLRPVLEAVQPRPSVRAMALGRLVGCIAHIGRRDDVEDALAEADRLLASDDTLSPDARRLEGARLSIRAAAYHRWYGDTEDAAEAAREGLTQLGRLRGLRAESDRLRAQLVLELVCALLDDGELDEAVAVSEDVLAEPVRATSAAAVGSLMLAVSTRVHLPSGRVDRGRGLLDQAVWVADRHGLDGLLADALTMVSQLDESAGHPTDALESLRSARAAEQRRLHAIALAGRRVLTEVGATDWDTKAVNALLRQVVHPDGQPVSAVPARAAARPSTSAVDAQPAMPSQQTGRSSHRATAASTHEATPTPAPAAAHAEPTAAELLSAAADGVLPSDTTDEATGLLNKEGLIRRLRSVRNGERPVALTLVRLENNGRSALTGGSAAAYGISADVELSQLAGRVRNIAPDHAELARSDGAELAVLLPHTTRDQAEKFAAAIETAWQGEANGQSISTGVVQSNPDAPAVDARALLTAARHAMTPAAEPAKRPGERTQPLNQPLRDAQALAELEDVGDTLRIGRAIISSLSIPTGSGGKRRADPAERPATKPTRAVGETGGYRSASTLRPVPNPLSSDTGAGHRSSSSLPPVTDTPDAPGHRSLSSVRPVTPTEGPANTLAHDAPIPQPGQASSPLAGTSSSHTATPYTPTSAAHAAPTPLAPGTPGPALSTPEPSPPTTFDSTASGTSGLPAPGTFDPASGAPGRSASGVAQPEDYRSSTYEQTKAELARMMSALNAGGLPPARSTDSTPLPAPSRPADDHLTNGTALPHPTPPTSAAMAEPSHRPLAPEASAPGSDTTTGTGAAPAPGTFDKATGSGATTGSAAASGAATTPGLGASTGYGPTTGFDARTGFGTTG